MTHRTLSSLLFSCALLAGCGEVESDEPTEVGDHVDDVRPAPAGAQAPVGKTAVSRSVAAAPQGTQPVARLGAAADATTQNVGGGGGCPGHNVASPYARMLCLPYPEKTVQAPGGR